MHVRFVVNILGTKNCTQSALKPHNKSPETRINAEFPSSIFLLKLNRTRRLTSKIIEYAVHALNFIDNTVHHLIKYCIRNLCGLGSHEVNSLDSTECYCVIVGSEVSHYAYASHIGKGCEVLVWHPVPGLGMADGIPVFPEFQVQDQLYVPRL